MEGIVNSDCLIGLSFTAYILFQNYRRYNRNNQNYIVSRGKKYLAPVLGFFEVLVWIMAISQIMQNLNNFVCYFAYAAGFATGTFVGIIIEEKLAIGTLL